jgi:hypothetical protein
MQKAMTGLLGAVAALGALGAAQAAPTPNPEASLKVSSFAELLEPIPDAAVRLKAMDEAQSSEGTVQLAYHHHHHHHRYFRRHHHHHHHHHYRR